MKQATSRFYSRPLCRLLTILVAFGLQLEVQAGGLGDVHREIELMHPSVSHIRADSLSRQLSSPASSEIVLFDVREPDEYAVSHLDGAIRVSPDISPSQFHQQYAAGLSGKTVVFYCSVGQRSSGLADRVQSDLDAAGVAAVFNLENGIFGWHNDQRPLRSKNRQTPLVHPYNWWWSRYLDHRNLLSYGPKVEAPPQ